MFLDNKYTTVYFSIIHRSLARTLSKDTYIEKHHIIPKSLGGTNGSSNLVKLTAREHILCHRLLIKMTIGNNKSKMVYAAWRMMFSSKLHQRPVTNSRVYEAIKKEMSQITSQRSSNQKHSDETKRKISKSHTGKKRNITPEWRAKIVKSATGLKRAPYSEEHKHKISNAQKGKPRGSQSDEHRKKVSESKKGKKLYTDSITGKRYFA